MVQMIDGPLPRSLKIGKISIGMIGLDIALNRFGRDLSLGNEEAAIKIFDEISSQNYIPAGSQNVYFQAIIKEVERLRGDSRNQSGDLVIRILGPGCVSCNSLQKLVIEIMSDMGIAADIFQVHDLDEIGRFGVMQTPALVINNKLKCSGRLPTRAQIEEWLREEIT
jgi:small redox-active disulfide protein 2